jgi:hypothetical protein
MVAAVDDAERVLPEHHTGARHHGDTRGIMLRTCIRKRDTHQSPDSPKGQLLTPAVRRRHTHPDPHAQAVVAQTTKLSITFLAFVRIYCAELG